MSDEFFDKFNALNEDGNEPEKASASDDSFESIKLPTDDAVPEQPAKAQTEQTSAWQRTYYSAPTQQPRVSYDPYTGKPIQAAPTQPTASASYNENPYSNTNKANSYVDADGYYHRSFTERRDETPKYSAPQPQKQEKKEKAKISTGAIAAILVVCIILSGFAGFGGSYLFSKIGSSTSSDSAGYSSVSDQLVIHKVSVENSSATSAGLVDKDTDEIVADVADSVVEVTTEVVQTNSFYGQYIAQGAGSGVIISEDGYIVTNNHVIEDASNITVTLRNGDTYEAKLIGTDADEDIALLKIEATGLTMAIFGDSDELEVGDKSIIIGNPLGTLGGSVTEGILSALDRSIVIDGKTMHLMQTDAAINPGNSGGGMFNGQGELVGIVVAKSGGSTSSGSTIDNIGFVIPINNVLNILGDLKQYGYVRGKADTGMSFVDITNQMYAWYYYNSSSTGVYISSVDRGSNAEQAGFSAGDRVISVDGKKVSSASDITSIIAEHSAGDTITFELERGNRTGSIVLTLEEYVPNTSSGNSSPFGSY